MENLLAEKKIKEFLSKIKNEVKNDKEVLCEWRANHADILVVDKENLYIYFEARIYNDGLYYLGETENNFKDILDIYFTDSKNLINYNEFKDLLNIDTRNMFFTISDEEFDYYSSLEREFALILEKDLIELTIHKGTLIHFLHKDPKGNGWNLTTLTENQPTSDIRGSYQECFYDLISQIKYEDLFIELARQNKIMNLNNFNKNGEREGLWIVPRENKWVKEDICYFKNDKLNGKYAEIYKNNEVAEIGIYKNNIKDGKVFSYSGETLNLQEEKNYENGILKYKENFFEKKSLYSKENNDRTNAWVDKINNKDNSLEIE